MEERRVFGLTHAQWMADAVKKRQAEWDRHVALEDAFAKIKPEDHWKGKIDTIIEEADYKACAEACVHYTATELQIVEKLPSGRIHVRAKGYWGGPCA